MSKRVWQFALLAGAIVSLIVVVTTLLQVILSPYVHGGPARVVNVNAGPYPLKVTFYADPANAGYALPFAIQARGTHDTLTYDVSAIPQRGTIGSIVHGDVSTGTTTADGTPGNVNITVRGSWTLRVVVSGPAGQGQANIPFNASAPPAIPAWCAWLIGLIPLYGIITFLLAQRRYHLKTSTALAQASEASEIRLTTL